MSYHSSVARLVVALALTGFLGCNQKPAVPIDAVGDKPIEKDADSESKLRVERDPDAEPKKPPRESKKEYPAPQIVSRFMHVTSGPGGEYQLRASVENHGAAGKVLVGVRQGERFWKMVCDFEAGESRDVEPFAPGFLPDQEFQWVIKAADLADAAERQGALTEKENHALRNMRQIRLVKDEPRPMKHALSEFQGQLPEVFWKGESDEGLARELNLRVWAFDYQGGAIACRVDVEETGQETLNRLEKQSLHAGLDDRNGMSHWEAKEGRIYLSMRRTLSERMVAIGKQLGREGSSEAVVETFSGPRKGGTTGYDFPFLWFHWQGVAWKEEAGKLSPVGDEEVTFYTVEATEVTKDANPRKVKLIFKARFLKPEELKAKAP
jgi:hypothetical protein